MDKGVAIGWQPLNAIPSLLHGSHQMDQAGWGIKTNCIAYAGGATRLVGEDYGDPLLGVVLTLQIREATRQPCQPPHPVGHHSILQNWGLG